MRVTRASRDYSIALILCWTGGALVLFGAGVGGAILAGVGLVACALTSDGAGA